MTREEQTTDVALLTAWLLSLKPEEYVARVTTLENWLEVLGDDAGFVSPDAPESSLVGVAHVVACLSASD